MTNSAMNQHPSAWREALGSLPADVTAAPAQLARWLLDREGGQRLEEGRRYFAYMKLLRETFQAIAEVFDQWAPPGSEGSKQHLRFTGPDEMLVLAHFLYWLSETGVDGCLLECGCAHGYSSCCLSHACAMLGRTLFVADSFQGLPIPRSDQNFFREGDYSAGRSEVAGHVRLLGRPDAVRYVEGWYKDTLRQWKEPIALLWMDVDLYESACDVMAGAYGALDRRGIIATHEFTDFHGQVHPRGKLSVPEAIYRKLEQEGRTFHSTLITRYFGAVAFEPATPIESPLFALALNVELARLDTRSRRYEELSHSRTVRTAFGLKRLLWPFGGRSA